MSTRKTVVLVGVLEDDVDVISSHIKAARPESDPSNIRLERIHQSNWWVVNIRTRPIFAILIDHSYFNRSAVEDWKRKYPETKHVFEFTRDGTFIER